MFKFNQTFRALHCKFIYAWLNGYKQHDALKIVPLRAFHANFTWHNMSASLKRTVFLDELSFDVDDPPCSCLPAMMILCPPVPPRRWSLVELSFDVDASPSSCPPAMTILCPAVPPRRWSLVEMSFNIGDPPSCCPPAMMILRPAVPPQRWSLFELSFDVDDPA